MKKPILVQAHVQSHKWVCVRVHCPHFELCTTRARPTSQLDLLIGKSVTVLSGEYLSEVKGFQWHCAK